MDFDFTTETITPDVSTILTVGGTGALELPSGTTLQEPGSAVAGAIRWNTTAPQIEYYSGASWLNFGGSVSSVAVSGGTTGLVTSGGPITTSGTITLSGTLIVSNGGTGLTTITSNGVVYGNGTSAIGATAAGVNGQVLIGNTGAAPSFTNTPAISGANFTAGSVPNSALTNNSITIGSTTVALGGTSTTLSGMTGITFASGTVTGVANPVNPSDVVSLQYLQSYEAGLEWKLEVAAASTVTLTVTYSNGASGVGATLTNAGTQAAFAIDGYTANLNDRILIKNQSSALQNGIYTVTTVGTGATNWVLTRATDDDTSAKMNNATTLVTNGTSNANTGWTQTTANPTMGTSNIVFVQFSGAGSGVSSFQTSLSGLTPVTATTGAVTLAGTLGATSGGTGVITAPTAGQLLVGVTGGTYVPFTVTTGTGISTTVGSGTFQINNTGVTSFSAGSTGLTPSTATTGAVALAGTLIVGNGGTGLTTINTNGVLYGNGTSAIGATAAAVNGQVLVGNTGAAPSFSSLSSIAVTSITGTANQITASAATGAVTLSTPGTFIAPGSIASTSTITAATGLTVTTGGALVSSGGVTISTLTANSFLYSGTAGLLTTTAAPTNGQLLIGSTGAAPVAATLTAGSNIYITNAAGSITVAGPKFYAEFTTTPVNAPSATASQSTAIGTGAVASKYGQFAESSGQFTAGGDAQNSIYMLRIITSNATPAIAFLDGSSAKLTLPINSAYMFDADIVCRRTDATGTYGAWNIKGLITQDATASTTAIQGSTSTTRIATIGAGLAANSVTATADTTSGALQFNVTGVAAETIRWVITCRTTEVANA